MSQVEDAYLLTYHLKASKGIPLVDKIAANSMVNCQS
jgi:hypothetical protein